jgi:WS/DGAT/MGAT family acyltransferase
MPAPWSLHSKPSAVPPVGAGEAPHGGLKHSLDFVFGQVKSAPDLYHAFGEFLHAARARAGSDLSVPYLAPKTLLNGRTSTQRHFASQQLPLKRLQDVASRAGVTVNDVFLAVCGGALRRYLADLNALPEQALIAGIPVSVRAKGDTSACTAVTFMLASMGTEEEDPLRRLHEVHRSTSAAKEHLHGLRREALTDYTLLLMTPYAIELLTGLGGHGHPVFNVVVSNVPGPAKHLYFNGARLEAIFPMSILTHGQSLNITVLSYAGQLHIGFTACAVALPDLQHLADYTDDAFEELATCVLRAKARQKAGPVRETRAEARHGAPRKSRAEPSSK